MTKLTCHPECDIYCVRDANAESYQRNNQELEKFLAEIPEEKRALLFSPPDELKEFLMGSKTKKICKATLIYCGIEVRLYPDGRYELEDTTGG